MSDLAAYFDHYPVCQTWRHILTLGHAGGAGGGTDQAGVHPGHPAGGDNQQ